MINDAILSIDLKPKYISIKSSLEALVNEVITFAKNDFHLLSYCYTFLLIIGGIYFNYSTGFYQNVMRASYSTDNSLWTFPLFYGITYFAVAIPVFIFKRDFKLLFDKYFYIKSIFFITLYGVSIGYFGYRNMEFPTLTPTEKEFVIKIISLLKGSIIYMIPLFLLKVSVDKQIEGIYGLARNSKHINAYLLLFAILLPFLIIASFTPDFTSAYPQFQPWHYKEIFGLTTWRYTIPYNTAYAIDFIKTELVFRGMLIIGMGSIMGRNAILPMVAMYAAIHFGKPLGETLSSIFGGYILGALAYQTRHIWGGVIVHICIALTMETMGCIQYYLLKH